MTQKACIYTQLPEIPQMTVSSIDDLIKLHEGLRLAAYDDATGEPVPVGGTCKGTLTIGYGHTGADVVPGMFCNEALADQWLGADIATATAAASRDIGETIWPFISTVRRAALIDMAFELGGAGLDGFHDLISAVHAEDWTEAWHAALDSDWARKVPRRAHNDAGMLLTGEWPA